MALVDEDLPAVAGAPANQPVMTQTQLLEFTNINGVNASLDALVGGGMSPMAAAAMLENAGYDLPDLAAPENVGGGAAPAPQVRRAEPNMRPTGAVMDVMFIKQLNSAGSQEEFNKMYDAMPKVQQHIYDRSFAQDIDPAWASQKAEEFYQMQDERAKVASSPQANALDMAQAEKAQKTVEMSNDILSLMDRLRGYKKGEKGSDKKTPKYFGRVGVFDSLAPAATSGDRAGWYIDHDTLESTLALAEAQANRGQGNFTETERAMLRSAATGGLSYRRDNESYAQIFEGMYDMFKNKAKQQTSQTGAGSVGSASASKPQRVSGGITYEKGDDGLWNPVQ